MTTSDLTDARKLIAAALADIERENEERRARSKRLKKVLALIDDDAAKGAASTAARPTVPPAGVSPKPPPSASPRLTHGARKGVPLILWSEVADQNLREMVKKHMSNAAIAKSNGRTIASVKARRRLLGLKKSTD